MAVAVGGIGVAVGGTGVGGIAVAVAVGTGVSIGVVGVNGEQLVGQAVGVAVGGTGVAVGGIGVAVGGTSVFVGVHVGHDVAVGGTGVFVGITTGGSFVAVGVGDGYHGRGVRVGVGVGHSGHVGHTGHAGHVAVGIIVDVAVAVTVANGQLATSSKDVATAVSTIASISNVDVGATGKEDSLSLITVYTNPITTTEQSTNTNPITTIIRNVLQFRFFMGSSSFRYDSLTMSPGKQTPCYSLSSTLYQGETRLLL
ncbi:MAG: hypothetical protein Q8N56_00610 [bacterium]|nr:hypothetical protein [bacterium]